MKRWFVLFLALLLLPWFQVWAAEKEEVTLESEMEPVTVMASQPGVEIGTDKTVIKMDEFKKPGSVRTITDVLKEVGGVDVQRSSPLMSSPGDEVSIRGMNEGRMVIEIDGRRINHTGHYGRYIVDWSTLNLDDVEKIEIIRGGHSVLHPFAIGGVINIVTKKGQLGQKKPKTSFAAGYGSYDTYHTSASVQGSLLEAFTYHISGSKDETDGYLRHNYQETDNLNLHFGVHFSEESRLSFNLKHSDVTYGLPVVNDPSREDYDPDDPDFYSQSDQLRHLNWPQYSEGDPRWEKKTNYLDIIYNTALANGEFEAHYFLTKGNRWTRMYSKMDDAPSKKRIKDRSEGFIAQVKNLRLFDRHSLTVGAEYQELGQPDGNEIIYNVISLYAQDVYNLSKRWSLTAGVRYYQVGMDTYFSQFGEGWPESGKEETEEGLYPSLKLDFQATPKTRLYAAVSRSYRLPCP